MFKLVLKSILFLVIASPILIGSMAFGIGGQLAVSVVILTILVDRQKKWSNDMDRDEEDYPY